MPHHARLLHLLLMAGMAGAQQTPPKITKPLHAQSASTLDYRTGADGAETVEIQNVTYQATDNLLLRKTTHSKHDLGDIGTEATVALEAWRLGEDPRQKPLYTLSIAGDDGHIVDNAIFVAARGLEETEWWSVYQLSSGKHLFDTYVPLLSFSISRDTVTTRYAGLEVPGDDTKDARLKQPGVVAVLTYASEERIVRQALLICDDAQKAQLLRSYADTTRTVSWEGGALKLSFSQNYPSPANIVEMRIPVRRDDLDLPHAQLPPRMHAAPFTGQHPDGGSSQLR